VLTPPSRAASRAAGEKSVVKGVVQRDRDVASTRWAKTVRTFSTVSEIQNGAHGGHRARHGRLRYSADRLRRSGSDHPHLCIIDANVNLVPRDARVCGGRPGGAHERSASSNATVGTPRTARTASSCPCVEDDRAGSMPARSPPSFLGCVSVLNSTWAGTQGDVPHLSAQVWVLSTALAEPKIVTLRWRPRRARRPPGRHFVCEHRREHYGNLPMA
jgi:hypothetical protein